MLRANGFESDAKALDNKVKHERRIMARNNFTKFFENQVELGEH
jgi:hypothetical protein